MRKKLREKNPELLTEWDYDKNIGIALILSPFLLYHFFTWIANLSCAFALGIAPDNFTGGSNKKVWWKCGKHGHSWLAQINKRFTFGRGCPYCSGNKVLKGFNDLTATHPEIAKQWDYEKNGELSPEQLSIGADKKIWWKCERGHSWRAVLYSRKNR